MYKIPYTTDCAKRAYAGVAATTAAGAGNPSSSELAGNHRQF